MFRVEVVTAVCRFTWAAQSLRLGKGRGARGGGVRLNTAVAARGRATPKVTQVSLAYSAPVPWSPDKPVYLGFLASAEAIIHFWFVLGKRAEQSCKRRHPYLRSTAAGLA